MSQQSKSFSQSYFAYFYSDVIFAQCTLCLFQRCHPRGRHQIRILAVDCLIIPKWYNANKSGVAREMFRLEGLV
uniref:Uncharacterized protein n=1 Tax=Arundo donax TaxID=35708 RepID=A0A0A9DJY1_ARUDO